MELVMNEVEWVESMVRGRSLGDKPFITLARYAIYLRERGHDDVEITRRLEDFLIRCDPSVNLLSWGDSIAKAVNGSVDKKLITVDCVAVTEDELAKIMSLKRVAEKKVMFALVCLAKFRNIATGASGYWVNYDMADVFKWANAHMSQKSRMLLLHDLAEAAMIGYNKRVDSVSIRVNIINEESTPVVFIHDLRNLGNQYLMLMDHSGYIECSECGRVVKRTGVAQKYCRDCAKRVNAMRALVRYHEMKNIETA